jgi:hypothetical protein
MRPRGLLILSALLPVPFTACTATRVDEPRVQVSPYLAVYQLRGAIGAQSEPVVGLPLQENPRQAMRSFGQDRFREDVGVRADLGDGFGGLRIDYYRLDMDTSQTGVLTSDFGDLVAGDVVRASVTMDELRAGWIEPIVDLESEYRDHPVRVQLGLGATFAHRDMKFRAATDDRTRTQNIGIDGDVVYLALRAKATWRDWSLDVDYAVSPELTLSGDFEDVLQDVEARVHFTLPRRDITLFAGYRYSELPASGRAGRYEYDADLRIDGFQVGFTLTF